MGAWIQCRILGFVLGLCSVSCCFFTNGAILRGDMTAHLRRGHIMLPHGLPPGPNPIPLHQTPDGNAPARRRECAACSLPRGSDRTKDIRSAQPATGMTAPAWALRPAGGPRCTAHAGALCSPFRASAVRPGSRGRSRARVVRGQGVMACALRSVACLAQLSYRVCL